MLEKIKLTILVFLTMLVAVQGYQEAKRIEVIERRVNMIQEQNREEVHYNAQLMKSLANKVIMEANK